MNRIAIIGSEGSMGKRYQAILRDLNVSVDLFDIHNWGQITETVGIEGIIIASPTHCHFENIREVARLNIPILCEKPIAQTMFDLNNILELNLNLTMVNQYDFIEGVHGVGPSYYDYFHTGKDGLQWDCINIIGLANDEIYINDQSPTWQCQINGKKLTLEDVYNSYISMVKAWLDNPVPNSFYITKAHAKVWENNYVKGSYRDSSKIDKHKTSEQMPHGNKRKDNVGVGSKSRAKVGKLSKQRQSVG